MSLTDYTHDNLDPRLGVALAPKRIDEGERDITPRSLHKLNIDSAELLRQLMEVTARGLGVSRFVYCELPILWVVDRFGEVWFAVEEVVCKSSHEFILPRMRNTKVENDRLRLGHPALLKGADGRIGGEIIFDVDYERPTWFINNGSGRYGLRPGRAMEHLVNAAEIFASYEIKLEPDFIAPMERD